MWRPAPPLQVLPTHGYELRFCGTADDRCGNVWPKQSREAHVYITIEPPIFTDFCSFGSSRSLQYILSSMQTSQAFCVFFLFRFPAACMGFLDPFFPIPLLFPFPFPPPPRTSRSAVAIANASSLLGGGALASACFRPVAEESVNSRSLSLKRDFFGILSAPEPRPVR